MKTRGRPRTFNSDTALDQAMFTFWEHAMGIGVSSLYATFGGKE